MASETAELLATAAVMRAVAHEVAARADEAYGEAKRRLLEAHESLGAKGADVVVLGSKVGTMSVSTASDKIRVADESAWQAWLKGLWEAGDDRVARRVAYDAEGLRRGLAVRDGVVIDPGTGEVVPGAEWVPGGAVLGASLRVSQDKLADAVAKAGVGARQALAMLDAGESLAEAPRRPGAPALAEGEWESEQDAYAGAWEAEAEAMESEGVR